MLLFFTWTLLCVAEVAIVVCCRHSPRCNMWISQISNCLAIFNFDGSGEAFIPRAQEDSEELVAQDQSGSAASKTSKRKAGRPRGSSKKKTRNPCPGWNDKGAVNLRWPIRKGVGAENAIHHTEMSWWHLLKGDFWCKFRQKLQARVRRAAEKAVAQASKQGRDQSELVY